MCKEQKPLSEFHKSTNRCKSCGKIYRKDYSKRDYVKRAESSRQLNLNYGITLADYDKMLAEQGGGCAVCGKEPNGTRLHVDHNHKTGAIRGLLCNGCNVALGSVDDNLSTLSGLIKYLQGKDVL
jgi:hypothetical protein